MLLFLTVNQFTTLLKGIIMQEINDLKAAIAGEFEQFRIGQDALRTELEDALTGKNAAEFELATYKAEIVQLTEEVRAPGVYGQPPTPDEGEEGVPVEPEPSTEA